MRKILFILVLMFANAAHAATAPAPQLTLADIRGLLIGTWQSADDTRFTREFDANGQSIDRYEGDASSTTQGAWVLFTGKTAPAGFGNFKLEPTGVYMELQQTDNILLFQISAISLSAVEMVMLQTGRTLHFTRLE